MEIKHRALPFDQYMPIKILNTFTKDWMIQARVSSRTELISTKNGGKLLKIELIDRNNS